MKKRGTGIAFKSIFGLVLLLTVFSGIVTVIGFNGMTETLLAQYADGAFRTANSSVLTLDRELLDEYAEKGESSEEYRYAWDRMSELCNASGATFIYVIQPDTTDYGHITFIFSTINENTSYSPYSFGYVRETTNDDYREKYRAMYEQGSEEELVIRDKGYIETDPHITAMVPVKGTNGEVKAILCVQRQMDELKMSRNSFVRRVLFLFIGIVLLVTVGQGIYLHRVLLRPVKKVTEEASRFAEEGVSRGQKLTDSIKNNDEIGLLAESIDTMEERISTYVEDIKTITAERERVLSELSLASRIQASMLPSKFPAFPDRTEFDVYASMDPAKEVGGDFYDFYLIDSDHLCLTIADVSGKGVPAALFMMASKIVLANYAAIGCSPAEILKRTNDRICQSNHEEMFVTVWLGILEISTGKLIAANAGHEYPILKRKNGAFELMKDKHSFVIGGMEGIKYKEYELELGSGDKLFLYTDGLTEANDANGEMFGIDGLVSALNENADGAPETIIGGVKKAVDDFAKEAEQFDDITMLCLEVR